jgi:hypothetical protein
MHLLRKLGRRLFSLAAVAAVVAGATVSLASPAAAVPAGWWRFQNNVNKTECLDVTSSGSAFQGTCNANNPYQRWDWVPTSSGDTYGQLRNQGSNRCLVSDTGNELNAVSTRVCDSDGENVPSRMLWDPANWTSTTILIMCQASSALWASPNKASIYTNENFFSNNAEWVAIRS